MFKTKRNWIPLNSHVTLKKKIVTVYEGLPIIRWFLKNFVFCSIYDFALQAVLTCMLLCSTSWGTSAFVLLETQRVNPEVTEDIWKPHEVVFHLPLLFCLFLCLPPFFHFPVSFLCYILLFLRQGGRKGWSIVWGSSSSCPVACCLCAILLPCALLRHMVLDGRDIAWADIYSCFLRKPGLLDDGSGNVRKTSSSQQQAKFPS